MASWPDVMFFFTEPGAKGLSLYKFNGDEGVTSWPIFLKGVELLEQTDRFKTIVIDTADILYDRCMEYICGLKGVDHPNDVNQGKGDYGGTWDKIRKEFAAGIHRILQTGRGVCFTSHAKIETFTPREGKEYQRIYPSMKKAAREVIEALVDYYFYAEYVGNNQRVLICQGDETLWAGARSSPSNTDFPRFLPLLKHDGFDIIQRAFNGEDVGIDPSQLVIAPQNSAVTQKFLVKHKTQAAASAAKPVVARRK